MNTSTNMKRIAIKKEKHKMTEIKYTFWDILSKNRIEIPIIQRDYAQGREGYAHIRDKFLKHIHDCLKDRDKGDSNKQIKLDFIYGYMENGVFYPLDGQQRLTTLWLVHLYIARKIDKLKQDEIIKIFQHFSYLTRDYSKDFCIKLCEELGKIKLDDGDQLTTVIKNKNWFYSSWLQDPTIVAMLRMIDGEKDPNYANDGISKVFNESENLAAYWKYLTEEKVIVFDYLNIEESKLSKSSADDLYIKMNARGKLLSCFENFKADLLHHNSNSELPNYLDKEWTDIFWKHYKNKNNFKGNIDEGYFAFINRFCFNKVCKKNKFSIADKIINDLTYFDYCESEQDFYKSFNNYEDCLNNLAIKEIHKILTEFNNHSDEINDILEDFSFLPTIDEQGLIKKIEWKDRVLFFVVCEYLLNIDNEKGINRNTDVFREFIRVMNNLKENIIRRSDLSSTIPCLKLIYEELLSGDKKLQFHSCTNFYHSLSNIKTKTDNVQLYEEIEKASQINKDIKYLEKIKIAEHTCFLNGSIRFLYINDKGNIDWNNFDKKLEFIVDNFDDTEVKTDSVLNFLKYFKNFCNNKRLFQKKVSMNKIMDGK